MTISVFNPKSLKRNECLYLSLEFLKRMEFIQLLEMEYNTAFKEDSSLGRDYEELRKKTKAIFARDDFSALHREYSDLLTPLYGECYLLNHCSFLELFKRILNIGNTEEDDEIRIMSKSVKKKLEGIDTHIEKTIEELREYSDLEYFYQVKKLMDQHLKIESEEVFDGDITTKKTNQRPSYCVSFGELTACFEDERLTSLSYIKFKDNHLRPARNKLRRKDLEVLAELIKGKGMVVRMESLMDIIKSTYGMDAPRDPLHKSIGRLREFGDINCIQNKRSQGYHLK